MRFSIRLKFSQLPLIFRITTVLITPGVHVSQKLYEFKRSNKRLILEKQFIAGIAEKIIFADQTTKTINYITSPEGIAAIEITANPGEREWYWVFTDHTSAQCRTWKYNYHA